MLEVDLIGPFTKSRNGSNWCLTETDHFTKRVEAIPIKEWWENNLKVILFAHNSIQASTEYGREQQLLTEVRLNIVKAEEKQKESYRSRVKKGTKCYYIRANYLVWKKDERKPRPGKPRCSFTFSWGHHLLRVTSVDANNLLQLEQLDSQPLKALTPYTSVKPNRQRPSTVRAPLEVSHPPEPVSSDQSDSLCSESDQLEELEVLPDTQTLIHLSSITNHPPTFHYIIYCCCHYLLRKEKKTIIQGNI
ncbi:uncharacterized protein ACWYII_016299 [Salvelinus alpinus]